MDQLPYGNTFINLDSDIKGYQLFKPPKLEPLKPQSEIVEHAFLVNMERKIDKQFFQGKTIGIAINDKSRPIPNRILLPTLLNYLLNHGAELKNLSFFISTGTHKPMEQRDFSQILDSEIYSKFKVTSHDCDNAHCLIYLGKTSLETPVFINRGFINSDVKILIGSIEPHHFMGFSGGVKTAAIGLVGRKTITANHAMLSHPNAVMGLFTSNPMRMDVEEIGKMIAVDFALNVILNDEKEIIAAYWGDPYHIMVEGIGFIRNNFQLDINNSIGTYDLVIASAGGYPKDINLYQAQKAITNACLFAKSKGMIILAAECREGCGSELFEQFMTGRDSPQEVIRDFETMQFKIGPHKAYQLAKQAIDHPIVLISELDSRTVLNMHLTPAKSLKQAYDLVNGLLPKDPLIAVLPYATHTLPKIFEREP